MARVHINIPYLKNIINESHMTQVEFSRSIGQGDSWARNALDQGYARDVSLKLLCRMYGADYARLSSPVPKHNNLAAAKPEGQNEILVVIANGLLRVENKLDRLLKALGEEVK